MKNYEYLIRTDLAVQNKLLKRTKTINKDNLTIKHFSNKTIFYTDIIFKNITNKINRENLKTNLKIELSKYLKKANLKKDSSLLIIGLGNKNIASDSLGPTTVARVVATGHLTSLIPHKRQIYTFTPGVMEETGYQSSKSIKSLTKELKPDIIILIDSLISNSITYLNSLIQITNSGITPGSGLANYNEELSQKTLKVPVICLGVPTAIEASTIIKDALNIASDKIKFKKGYDLTVSRKDIDIFIKDISSLIATSLNELLNNFNTF